MASGNINTQADPSESRSGSGWEQQMTTQWRQGPDGYWYRVVDGQADPQGYAYPFDSSYRAVDPMTGQAYSDQGGSTGGGSGSAYAFA